MGYTDKAVQAHMKAALHAGYTPMAEKIADLTHADANKHTITLSALGIPDNAVAVLVWGKRITGTGQLYAYPLEGAEPIRIGMAGDVGGTYYLQLVPVANARLEYALTVANDDWDLWCFGYFTSGQVLG